jgi:hypothetical protein
MKVKFANPPDDTVWFAGSFVTEMAGAAGITVTRAEAFPTTLNWNKRMV